ncbi:type I secretion system permease/ATPase [Sulfitobacter sp. JBTF-M27]|uniref:Type I secretion system permease/ATPase n=1 Tax=Sulfitobacter sediminilitoris TaxID=2698830 RepID=A0A6P0CI78_9RHOB|nr:type I secretion system permease/ATPase [Sulfitobacter sediminilitoris]
MIAWFAEALDQPFSEAAVLARLPADPAPNDKTLLARALSTVGLRTKLATRDLRRLDPIVLPCVVFERKTGKPLILQSYSRNRKTAEILDVSEGLLIEEVSMSMLRKRTDGKVLFVTANALRTQSLLSPEARAKAVPQRHWFWSPFLANWTLWAQIIVAVFVINVLSLALPLFVMNVYDRVIPNLAYVTLWTLAFGVLIALMLDLFLRMLRNGMLETIGRRVDVKAAAEIFRQAMNVKLLARPGGAAGIINTVRDFEMVREFFASSTFVSLIDLLFIGVFIAVLFVIVGPLAYVPMIAVPVVLVMALFAQYPIGRTVDSSQQLAVKRHVVLVESLLGIETVKSMNAEPVMQREWEKAISQSARINGRTRFWSNFAVSTTMLTQQAVSVGIIVWGVFLVADGRITIGALIAANILAGRVLAPLGNIAQTLFRAQHAIKAMRSLSNFMKLPIESPQELETGLQVKKGALEFKDVSFSYPDSPVPALQNIKLRFEPGETVALLGRVGSGKSTLGKMCNGLLSPDTGIILVDGKEIAQYDPAELRDGVAFLTQETELFTGTIRENLMIGRPHATEEEIRRALYYAAMDVFIAENPAGLQQFIGEKGNRLSGGQRQGLAIARMVLRNPKVAFLDEPTSAMDRQMESTITTRLAELAREGMGLVLCTHRQSLAEIANRVVVMEKGQVVLDGPRAEVAQKLRELSNAKAAE